MHEIESLIVHELDFVLFDGEDEPPATVEIFFPNFTHSLSEEAFKPDKFEFFPHGQHDQGVFDGNIEELGRNTKLHISFTNTNFPPFLINHLQDLDFMNFFTFMPLSTNNKHCLLLFIIILFH